MPTKPITIENKVPRCVAVVPPRDDGDPHVVKVYIDDHVVLYTSAERWDDGYHAAVTQIADLSIALDGLRKQLVHALWVAKHHHDVRLGKSGDRPPSKEGCWQEDQ